MVVIKASDWKSEKFLRHVKKLDEIAQLFGYTVDYKNGVICVSQVEYDFYNTSITVFHKWDDDCNDVYYRFAVAFSGFGAQEDETMENKIAKSVENAKACVDSLNIYLKKMEKDYGTEK